jgi:hypothetical protein
MNFPKRPVLMTIGLPQVGQMSSVGSSRCSNFGSFSRPRQLEANLS